jgi:hypothetical protein
VSRNPAPGRAAVGRADLARLLATGDKHDEAELAESLGYRRRNTAPPRVPKPQAREEPPPLPMETRQPTLPLPEEADELPDVPWFRVVERTRLSPQEITPAPPAWYRDATLLTEDQRPDPAQVRLPARRPLTPWARL